MKRQLLKLTLPVNTGLLFSLLLMSGFIHNEAIAQTGAWTALTLTAPDLNGGGMLLLSDGTVLCKTFSGGSDGIGNIYDKLTPDSHGSYVNGTWSRIAPMINTRLYYSSQVLKDGRVYVAGGEYGSGGSSGETYNPLTNTWTSAPSIGSFVSDANSEILSDGTVIQALVTGTLKGTKIYSPATNTYVTGPTCLGIHNESAWVKLADNSILFVDRGSRNSERFIPSLNQWVSDATVPVDLYDPYGLETGGAVLLPDGRAFFIGSLGHNAIYTPSGTNSPGSWTAAADLPNGQGTPDAAAAMMINGKVLCATSPVPTSFNHFPSPTSYYEYDYTTNTFTRVNAPAGGLTTNIPSYYTGMVALPNGQILFATQNSAQYYVYTPAGSQINTGKPVIKRITRAGAGSFRFVGTGFNGISEGATYGDDWQMNTNYPIVRISSATNVYYLRSFNWNRTGVMTGSQPDTFYVTIPLGIPRTTYSLVVTANGISSDPVIVPGAANLDQAVPAAAVSASQSSASSIKTATEFKVYPNPAKDQTSVQFTLTAASHVDLKLLDMGGKVVQSVTSGNMSTGYHSITVNTTSLSPGVYIVRLLTDKGEQNAMLLVQ